MLIIDVQKWITHRGTFHVKETKNWKQSKLPKIAESSSYDVTGYTVLQLLAMMHTLVLTICEKRS